MPNRPRPRPAPQAFDVFKPGKGKPSPTSRPVIVSDKPPVQDSTVVEHHGSLVPNAHHGQQPVLGSLSPRKVAPSAHAIHQVPTPAPEPTEPDVVPEIAPAKKVSHGGHIISRPSGTLASRHATLMHHKMSPSKVRVKPPEELEKEEEPSLAAVPITPVETPAGLANAKTEGKEELLAAMPVEIRRSVADATGQTAADWDMPAEASVPAAPAPVATKILINDGSTPQTATPSEPAETVPVQTSQPASVPAQAAPAGQQLDEAAMPLIKTDKKRYSDAIIFIIMMVLFLGLGTVVVLLFVTGTVSL